MARSAHDLEFYVSHSGYVRALARHVVFDEQLAADFEQLTWLAALEHGARDVAAPRKWLETLVRNFAIKAWRGNARRGQREERAARLRAAIPTPAEIVEHENMRRRIVGALLGLDEPYRSVLLLRYFEDRGPSEIAVRLHLPVETVRTHLKRGLERLRVRLRRDAGSDAVWSVAIVHALGLDPPSYGRVALMAARSFVQGVVTVSIAQKSYVAIATLLLAISAFWLLPRGAAVAPVEAVAPLEIEWLSSPTDLDAASSRESRTDVGSAVSDVNATRPVETALTSPSNSLLVRVSWLDGTPAPFVGLQIARVGAENSARSVSNERTDRNGTCLLHELPPGPVVVEPDRGGYGAIQVPPNEACELSIVIPRGADLAGLVVDERGQPVADAEVWLQTKYGYSSAGFVVAHSDERGRFLVRSVVEHMGATCWTQKRGLAPSDRNTIAAAQGESVPLRLVLRSSGAALRGRVVDEHDQIVPGALVMLGDADAVSSREFPDGSRGFTPGVQLARADARGEFEFSSVALERTQVRARAAGFASWTGVVDTARSSPFEIALQPTPTLRGTVRAPDGSPVPGAIVSIGRLYDFASLFVRADNDGAYFACDLPLEDVEITAELRTVGFARTQRSFRPGEEARWDPVLSLGLIVAGNIVAPGRELGDYLVHIDGPSDSAEPFTRNADTDASGRFEFADCPDEELCISVFVPDDFAFAVATVEHVRAGGAPLQIALDLSREPNASIVGRIVDATGTPLPGATLTAWNASGRAGRSYSARPGDARFEIRPLPSGAWTIEARARGLAPRRTPVVEVASGATVDIGDIVLEQGGSVVATLTGRTDGVRGVLARSSDGVWSEWIAVENGVARSGPLCGGSWTLAPLDNDLGVLEATALTITPGVEALVSLAARRPR